MSECEEESLTQDILEASKEEQAIETNNNIENDLSNNKQHSMEMKKMKEEPQLPVSDSPGSIAFHSSGGSFASEHEIPHPAAAVANRIVHEAEHDCKVEEGIVSGGNSGFLMSKKEAKVIKALLWIRIFALVLSLISFTVMADDTNKGHYHFSFYDSPELKYCLSVNVTSFIYCAFQIWDLLNYLFTKKHLVNHKWVRHCTFAMDQVLTYLLLSASASAITMARYFYALVGYEFITMAKTSIAFSFLAFKAFALATLLSVYLTFKFN